MSRIFIWANPGRQEKKAETRAMAEVQQVMFLLDQTVSELRSRGCEIIVIPEDFPLVTTIEWINQRCRRGDIAFALQSAPAWQFELEEVNLFYTANNIERKKQAELLLLLLLRRLPELVSHGAKPDTATELGRLDFCRQIWTPSLWMAVGGWIDAEAQENPNNYRRKLAIGIADGLIGWSREVSGIEPNQPSPKLTSKLIYPSINISLNNQLYDEQGILIDGDAWIPIDLSDRLEVELNQSTSLIQYQGVVYLKAIELRDGNISVAWDNLSRTVILRSILSINRHQIDQIMSQGNTSEVQLMIFLKANNENALNEFSDLPNIYREEGTIEGVNYDIAFCQMCLETNFLHFSREVQASQNNFANLGAIGGGAKLPTFPNSRLGVRAQIQHLKAYASLEPLVQQKVDPRFHLVRRGIAPKVSQLSGRWSGDLDYGQKIMAMLRRLYESANLL